MKQRYLKQPLPAFGTPERRSIRIELIDYRERMLQVFYHPKTKPKRQRILTKYLYDVEIKLSEP